MTGWRKRQVLDMAREAGWMHEHDSETGFVAEAAFKFAELVRADEREACAKVCEDSVEYAGDTLADAIRARSNHAA
jgi:hypothetical protein